LSQRARENVKAKIFDSVFMKEGHKILCHCETFFVEAIPT